jgi:hypothetical protein
MTKQGKISDGGGADTRPLFRCRQPSRDENKLEKMFTYQTAGDEAHLDEELHGELLHTSACHDITRSRRCQSLA